MERPVSTGATPHAAQRKKIKSDPNRIMQRRNLLAVIPFGIGRFSKGNKEDNDARQNHED